MTKKSVSRSEKNTYRYGLQESFCLLYEDSKKNKNFKRLMKHIVSEENIVLAYRNICKNKGSFTAGADGKILRIYKNIQSNLLFKKSETNLYNINPNKFAEFTFPKQTVK